MRRVQIIPEKKLKERNKNCMMEDLRGRLIPSLILISKYSDRE